MVKVAPSVLTADFTYLGDTVRMLDKAGADWIHCDIMDGVYVPNMSFGWPMIRAFRKITDKPLDVHLMISDPLRYIEEFAGAGADIITIHPESPSSVHLHRVVTKIRACGKKAGVALNPATSLDVLDYIYDDIDLLLVMSVNPGFGGQSFIPAIMKKIEDAAGRISRRGLKIEIEVDGGVSVKNAADIRSAGATVLVGGHAVVDAEDPAEAIRILKGAESFT
ncbi:MAG: ribulose-phosphate 3-epimerase [Spirochaetales bacterium]|jgi:ribulose-phosphate 3-epimerase|nr:ribulose-phosphate 3-epimerase [Spirochaetales bacterium]